MNAPTLQTSRAVRLDLMICSVQSLPGLPEPVVSLLQVHGPAEAQARRLMERVQADGELVGNLQLIPDVAPAPNQLNFDAVRSALLWILARGESVRSTPTDGPEFNVAGFWLHSLAVAIAARAIANAAPQRTPASAAQAFIGGLLHDIGKLLLEHLMPKGFRRALDIASEHRISLADAERQVIGMNHMTVGKRLAEHWRLPHAIQDCIWFHGAMWTMLPTLPHKQIVAAVSVADRLIREHRIGFTPITDDKPGAAQLAAEAGLDPSCLESAIKAVEHDLAPEAASHNWGDWAARVEAILARWSQAETQSQLACGEPPASEGPKGISQALHAICEFQEVSTQPGRSVHDVLDAVAQSATQALGPGYCALLYQSGQDKPGVLNQYVQGNPLPRRMALEPVNGTPRPFQWPVMGDPSPVGPVPDWLRPHLAVSGWGAIRCVPLPCAWGTVALLIRPGLEDSTHLRALARTWGAAIAAAAQHDGARRLGEQIVESNRQLTAMQHQLSIHQSMARVGEMAAGAAHEMNNPLAVISGRAQLLLAQLPPGSREQHDAARIQREAQRLSDLITALRAFALPPAPSFDVAGAAEVIEAAVRASRRRETRAVPVNVRESQPSPQLWTDGKQLAAVLEELLVNAYQAGPRGPVNVETTVDPLNDRFIVKVTDDGIGMSASTLEHAFDPFFSVKPAGRQTGLGLSRARRLVEGLGGEIRLTSQPNQGTTVTVSIPLKRAERTPAPAGQA